MQLPEAAMLNNDIRNCELIAGILFQKATRVCKHSCELYVTWVPTQLDTDTDVFLNLLYSVYQIFCNDGCPLAAFSRVRC